MRLEQVARAVVPGVARQADAGVEPLDGVLLDLQVELELLRDGLADLHLAEALQVGDAFEEEDALDELVGVLHLVDGLLDGSASQSRS